MSQGARVVPEGVPLWQPDESARECPFCHRKFTFFNRRHHCRKCGRVVCGDCSSVFTCYLPNTYVVSPQSQMFLETPHVPHRTCDECAAELERQGHRSQPIDMIKSSSAREDTLALENDENLCPVCNIDLSDETDAGREQHINNCLHFLEFTGSPDSKRQTNRMLVYTLDANVRVNEDNECVICFEEFHAGDKVGRLECLCCFHYKCIKDWINRKGACECPVHAVAVSV
ncbi:uncharacterized protein OGAPODRAFT_16891 [Ogataea polymorpha]|uniref:uncharacterized protein n=1 Tax=Ogataea polymorpha TaxID=460523 RepID=UPI0007F494B2|nr:uncharacterized protein OGAPODRAFT_16891 [Ogataea polymorpha]OBA15045.1 hypothetical protein OGAPODRAFT_16891 [Ogataea polymorpha]